jgi:hypothetical protein
LRLKTAARVALGREGVEERELRERQAVERKAMYQEQARGDRAVLREAHDAQKHRASTLGALPLRRGPQAGVSADQAAVRREIAPKPVDPDKDTREADALKLKSTQKEAYGALAKQAVDAVRPIKNERWQKSR